MAISLAGFAASAAGTTSATPSYPGSEAANDLILCHVAGKPFVTAGGSGVVSFANVCPLGYVNSGSVAGGSGTGSVAAHIAGRIAEGAIGGTETLTGTSTTPILGVMSRWTIASGKQWALQLVVGQDTDETGTGVSATGTTLPVQPNDVIVVGVAIKDDGITHTSQTVTLSGATLSAVTWQSQFTTATGDQASMYVGYCTVTAGTVTAAPVYVATSSVSGSSSCAVTFLRLREQDPALGAVPMGMYGDPLVEPESHTHNPPIVDGNGNRYRLGESNIAHDTNRVAVHKSSDGGKTWKAANWASHPTAQDLEGTWTLKGIADPTTLYFWTTRDDTVWLVPFRMSTNGSPDTYGTQETVDTGLSSTGVTQYVSAAELSDGTFWVAYSDTLAGANNQIAYRKRTATNTYGTKTTLSDGTGLNLTAPVLVRGASDVCYLFYKDNTTSSTLFYRTLTSGGTLSGRTQVTASLPSGSSYELSHTNAVYYDDNGTEVIGIAYIGASDILKYREIRGGVLQSEETISTAAITRNPGTTDSRAAVAHLAVDGKDVHAMWSRAADGDLLRDVRVFGTGWGTDTVVWASGGQTGWYVYCDVITEGSNVKLVYTYDQGVHIDDGSNITYNEVTIRTVTAGGPTTVSVPMFVRANQADQLWRP